MTGGGLSWLCWRPPLSAHCLCTSSWNGLRLLTIEMLFPVLSGLAAKTTTMSNVCDGPADEGCHSPTPTPADT
jgi:hypothetical protein